MSWVAGNRQGFLFLLGLQGIGWLESDFGTGVGFEEGETSLCFGILWILDDHQGHAGLSLLYTK